MATELPENFWPVQPDCPVCGKPVTYEHRHTATMVSNFDLESMRYVEDGPFHSQCAKHWYGKRQPTTDSSTETPAGGALEPPAPASRQP